MSKVVINIPNENIKSKLIGRDGRVIRLFKEKYRVNLIINDSPGVIFLEGEGDLDQARNTIFQMIQDNNYSI